MCKVLNYLMVSVLLTVIAPYLKICAAYVVYLRAYDASFVVC